MKPPRRLRVSRTTIRTLDVNDMVFGGGTPFPTIPTMTCLSCANGENDTTCNGSGGDDCTRHITRLVTL